MKPEKLIPVRSESELRAGMIVIFKGCTRCGGSHRFMLLRRDDSSTCWVGHTTWRYSPPAHPRAPVFCAACTVGLGGFFRVDDGLDAEQDKQDKQELAEKRRRVEASLKARP